ncbi:MAG TPA: VWA domain-containing protein [Acidimicrobiales bacterium]|nr:VWA domain-containing protein [Acidimicrobiales bacterium]
MPLFAVTLLAPSRLWLLAPVVVLVLAYLVRQVRRRQPAVRHTDVAMLAAVSPRRAGWRRHLPAAGLVLGLAALVLGLARPAQAVEVPRDDAVVVLVIDTSLSMRADDVAPDRLTAALAAAEDFVASAPSSHRIGLVTFGLTARSVTAPTTDRQVLLDALSRLETFPTGGTAGGDGLNLALDAIEGATADAPVVTVGDLPYQAVVMLADGGSNTGASLEEAGQRAAEAEIPVFTVSYGTPEGEVVVDDRVIPAPNDPASMADLAEVTDGQMYPAASAEELRDVYERIGTHLGTETEVQELTVPLAALAAAVVALALAGSFAWSPRLT